MVAVVAVVMSLSMEVMVETWVVLFFALDDETPIVVVAAAVVVVVVVVVFVVVSIDSLLVRLY